MSETPGIIFGEQESSGEMVLICDHAANTVPPPLEVSEDDQFWLHTHWAWDIGAAAVTCELARRRRLLAVLSSFSRLVCDPNRSCDDPTWIRTHIEGHPLSFNQQLDAEERQRRLTSYYEPYHQSIDGVMQRMQSLGGEVSMLSIHSFTPRLGNDERRMETGILYDRYEPVARRLAGLLEGQGFTTALNEPYSGLAGMMTSAQRHGTRYGVIYLQLEIRQDLIATDDQAHDVAERISAALDGFHIRRR